VFLQDFGQINRNFSARFKNLDAQIMQSILASFTTTSRHTDQNRSLTDRFDQLPIGCNAVSGRINNDTQRSSGAAHPGCQPGIIRADGS
jgi:hypothetical protein